MADNQFRRLPQAGATPRQVAEVVNRTLDGGINATGSITLAVSAATTAVADKRLSATSYFGLMPTTANASAELGNGTIYVSAQGKQTLTLTHANNSQSDRTYRYVILG